MAGDWIPVRKGLKDELEVMRLSVLTGLSRRAIVSILLDFWSWCDSVTGDGIIKGVTLDEMSAICPDVERTFWRHLADVGWIVETVEGIAIPNFDRWMGKSAKKRLKDALQKRYNRFADRNVRVLSASKSDISSTTEQNRTVNKDPLPPSGETETLPSAFGKFWLAYPRRVQQGAALRAWNRIAPDEALAATILAAVERQKQSAEWQRDGGRWILNPSHWLRRQCWTDESNHAKTGETTEQRHARIARETAERRAKYDGGDPQAIRKKLKGILPKTNKKAAPDDSEDAKG